MRASEYGLHLVCAYVDVVRLLLPRDAAQVSAFLQQDGAFYEVRVFVLGEVLVADVRPHAVDHTIRLGIGFLFELFDAVVAQLQGCTVLLYCSSKALDLCITVRDSLTESLDLTLQNLAAVVKQRIQDSVELILFCLVCASQDRNVEVMTFTPNKNPS